MIPSLVEIK